MVSTVRWSCIGRVTPKLPERVELRLEIVRIDSRSEAPSFIIDDVVHVECVGLSAGYDHCHSKSSRNSFMLMRHPSAKAALSLQSERMDQRRNRSSCNLSIQEWTAHDEMIVAMH